MRTPLSALQIQIGNLRHDDREGRFCERLAELDAGIGRAGNLVGRLLHLARHDAREPTSTPQPIDLVRLTLDTVARPPPLAESRGIDFGVTCQGSVTVTGSLADIEIILGNLVENAVRYTPPGALDVAMAIGQEVRSEVRDTRPGIAQEDMPRVFERFFRARPQDSKGAARDRPSRRPRRKAGRAAQARDA